MRRALAFGAAASLLAIGTASAQVGEASGSARQACLDAALRGQGFMVSRRLVEARAALTECAHLGCPGLVVRDCTRWLDDVQAAMPSVVLDVRDPDGRNPTGMRVEVDSKWVPDASTGKAFDVDPGEHSVRVERDHYAPFDQRIVVHEGERDQVVAVRVPGPAPASSVAIPPAPHESGRVPAPALAWVFGGVGVLAMGVFSVSAIKGIVDRHDLACDTGCAANPMQQVNVEFDVADVALPVGIVSLAIAAWIYLSRGTEPRSAFSVQPLPQGMVASWRAAF